MESQSRLSADDLTKHWLLNLVVEIPVDVHRVLPVGVCMSTRHPAHKKNIGSAGSLPTTVLGTTVGKVAD